MGFGTFTDPLITGGGALIRALIKSVNYVAGVSGWMLDKDGAAEFSEAVIRGEISAGAGTVVLNGGGVRVDGTQKTYQININAGFLARRIPDDGAVGELFISNTGPDSGTLFLLPTTPTATNSNPISTGLIRASIVTNGAEDQPYLNLTGPNITGLDSTRIKLYGDGSLGKPRVCDIASDALVFEGVDMGRGNYIFDASFGNVGPSASTTNIVAQTALTSALPAFKSTRRFTVTFAGTVQSTVALDRIGFQIYVGASQVCDFGQITCAVANVGQPYSLTYGFTGAVGQDVTLQVRRVAGTGNFGIGRRYVQLDDTTSI